MSRVEIGGISSPEPGITGVFKSRNELGPFTLHEDQDCWQTVTDVVQSLLCVIRNASETEMVAK